MIEHILADEIMYRIFKYLSYRILHHDFSMNSTCISNKLLFYLFCHGAVWVAVCFVFGTVLVLSKLKTNRNRTEPF